MHPQLWVVHLILKTAGVHTRKWHIRILFVHMAPGTKYHRSLYCTHWGKTTVSVISRWDFIFNMTYVHYHTWKKPIGSAKPGPMCPFNTFWTGSLPMPNNFHDSENATNSLKIPNRHITYNTCTCLSIHYFCSSKTIHLIHELLLNIKFAPFLWSTEWCSATYIMQCFRSNLIRPTFLQCVIHAKH